MRGLGLLTLGVLAGCAAAPPADPLDGLRFLVGRWQAERDGVTSVESWTVPHLGIMFGQNRTVRGEQTEFFELLSITVDGDRVAYIAQPRGAAPTRFEMTALGERSVTFANPQHDFPKRIRYRLVDGDRLRATVDNGTDDGQRLEFAWRRVR